MSRDLDYFTEFLENPSKPSLGEFYRMAKEWGTYLQEHKGDFNYLEDDDWKEIRERFIAEYLVREEEKQDVEDEWACIGIMVDRIEELSDLNALALLKRQTAFLEKYRDLYNVTDEMLKDSKAAYKKLEKSMKEAKIAEAKLRISEQNLQQSIADLDDHLVEAEEKTGKKQQMFFYKGKKGYKGN